MRLAKSLYFLLALFFCSLIVLKSFDYFNPNFTQGFLIGKEKIFPFYKIFLYAHITASPIALISGLFQFSFTKSKFHKIAGAIYVISVLLLASPGSLVMSWFAIGGEISTLNFSLMSILWFYFTLKAYLCTTQSDFTSHRNFMIRSFILTNSAILIRLLSYFNNEFDLMNSINAYILISWLSWLPILVTFELKLKLKT